jgi:RNA polymerase sigma-70 factor (ECF subfamily)
LLLVDVLGWRPEEAAEALEASVFSINSLLQRARGSVAQRRERLAPEVSSSDAGLLQRFISTWESGDLEGFASLLSDDALLSMPPQPEWYSGRDAVRQFFEMVWAAMPGERRLVPIAANGGPAVAVYRRSQPDSAFEATGITLLTLREGRISHLTRFTFANLFTLFGLPLELPSDARA